VLTARRGERLKALADDLHQRHAAKCRIVPLDLAEIGAAHQLWESVADLEIEILVNNAGFSHVSTLTDAVPARILQLVQVNVCALTELAYLALPPMLERGHGGIINVASLTGFQPVAYMAAYSASKAYALHFSESLWAEARDHGVHVMALCPGTTQTELFDVAGVPGWLKKRPAQSPEQVVKAALRSYRKRHPVCIPGWRNWSYTLFGRFLSRRRVVLESMKYFRPPPPSQAGDEPLAS